ncbi:helix-turn-helix transcriptional regulator [Faecalicatena sp. AGMB00832]|uniref:Helix-turn-helix transcriptional regulator n=1 Tax=Faecalicatena faecalis TaxID=2726362 RepID=A0ABS6CYT4_9FIRM|nr:helix-turn-helix transcriptional regulator [Faecalicatena faecalis]MBU3874311.1 helix-turn-helix transcriptional regulator [Faecalicatena faecalis]
MTIGEKIQKCRKEQKMSQEELAGRLGVSRQAVSKWELNESVPDTENVIELGRIFNVSLDYLLKMEIEEPEDREKENTEENQNVVQAHEGRQEERKRMRHPGLLILSVCTVLIMIWTVSRHAALTGIVWVVDLWVFWGIGYLIFLVVRALKKYIQR